MIYGVESVYYTHGEEVDLMVERTPGVKSRSELCPCKFVIPITLNLFT